MGVQIGDCMVSLAQLQEVPPENMILLAGPPGAGKSGFCEQVILRSAAVDRPIIYVTTERGASKAKAALRERGLGEIRAGLINFVDAYSETVGLSFSDRPDTVTADCASLSSIGIAISKLQERIGKKDVLLVFDSLTSPYLLSGAEVVRFMRLALSKFTGEGNSVLACFDEGSSKEEALVAMMSLSNGVIKMKIEKNKQLLDVVKHPKVTPTRIEVPIEPERVGIETRNFNPPMLKQYFQALRKDEAWARREVGDLVNLFWPTLVPWSGMLWDPKRFPEMTYQANKDDGPSGFKNEAVVRAMFPWYLRLLKPLVLPKSFSKVKDMKKLSKIGENIYKQERSGILEYLDDVSKTDEHYFRIYENFECWGFKNVGATMASYIPPAIAGAFKGFELWSGLERDWNCVETKCIGLGDPYCEFKLVPGEIPELSDSLEKDSSVIERIHDNLMHRLMGFLLEGKPLVEKRPNLGSDVHLHPVSHYMGCENIPFMGRVWAERYKMALRLGGAKAGKEVGEHLLEAGIKEDKAVNLVLHLLEHCKVGKVTIGETIQMKENCESALAKILPETLKEPSCFFTTGFLNGFFSAVKNQHVKETKCIAMGDPYCEWEFR
jgi:predicted hydrocarbon binding protein/KaiC/GvpD/RAD55 family RecA-like ATPase